MKKGLIVVGLVLPVFGVKISVENINDELKPGMPAEVKIFLK